MGKLKFARWLKPLALANKGFALVGAAYCKQLYLYRR